MKATSVLSSFIAALCLAGLFAPTVLPQSLESRPRRVQQSLAFNNNARAADPRTAAESESASLDTLVSSDGLQFYFEARGSGLAQLAQSPGALAPMIKMLARPLHTSANDFTAFAVSQAGTLAKAKLAFVGYGAKGTAALIEAANATDAEALRAGVARLLGGRGNTASAEASIAVRGRVVLAGEPIIVSRLTEANGAYPLSDTPLFARARERFSSDPLFAYVEVSAPQLPAMTDAHRSAEMTNLLAGLGMQPYAVALGGRLEDETLAVHALMFINQKRSASPFAGLFSSVASGTTTGQMMAANFAAPDTDVLIDFQLDWDKVLQSLESMFAAFASGPSNNSKLSAETESADPMARAEQSLGFSIRNDLLPALGNEVAISLSSFDSFLAPQRPAPHAQKASTAGRVPPRFMLMVALKDAAKFERVMARLSTKSGATPLPRTAYHGAMIVSGKSITYAVTKDFFILGSNPGEIRRALDAYFMGNSLAVSPAFRAAMGNARETTMQLYVSSAVTTKLFETLQIETAKANGSVKELAQPPARVAGLGMSLRPDADGLLVEMRAPANLAFAAIATLAASKPASPGVAAMPAAAAPRQPRGSSVPMMTEDDVVIRKP